MDFEKSLKQKLFLSDDSNFEKLALEVFQFQALQNSVYHEYIQNLGIRAQDITSIYEIPYLPISFFKKKRVITGHWSAEATFESSGTTGSIRSKHYVKSIPFYLSHSLRIFTSFYGKPRDYHVLALLPSYLERDNSSLVLMVKHLIDQSKSLYSGFYLDDLDQLYNQLKNAKKTTRRILLIGVSFALLDFIEKFQIDLKGHIVMETGGLKGRRKEIIRQELHKILKEGFNLSNIHSEYGMTELMSQAYSNGSGAFKTPSSMKLLLRDTLDPFNLSSTIDQGGVNIIDLGNIDSCSFIETEDIGKRHPIGYEILGRFDNSDIRGCNLMI